jgi:hypothetical protein
VFIPVDPQLKGHSHEKAFEITPLHHRLGRNYTVPEAMYDFIVNNEM